MRPLSICVYCSASNEVDQAYFQAAAQLGMALARRGYRLVYGGGSVGLMGVVAQTVQTHGGAVLGVIPEALVNYEGTFEIAEQLVVTRTMRERKQIMEDEADAFIALPGGFGTWEEMLEIITLKQLHYQAKPLVILNVAGYYDPLLAFFDQAVTQRFVRQDLSTLFWVTADVEAALDYIARTHGSQGGPPDEAAPPPEDELRETMEGP